MLSRTPVRTCHGFKKHLEHIQEKEEKKKIQKTCHQCGQNYECVSNLSKYCCKSCKYRSENSIKIRVEENRICVNCGKEFSARKDTKTACCSRKCGVINFWKTNI